MSDHPRSDTLARSIYMANQIARNFAVMGDTDAAAATADHIVQFWSPRMRHAVLADPAGLGPVAAAAVLLLREHGAPPVQTRATAFNAADEPGHGTAG